MFDESLRLEILPSMQLRIVRWWRQVMASNGQIGRRVPQIHRFAPDAPRIVIVFENEEPIDLLDFTASLTAIAREHEAHTRRVQPKTDIDETRLLVVDVRKGSVILELLPALAPLVATVEYANAAIEFVKHLSSAAAALRRPGGRIEGATTQQLKNLNDMVVMVAKDSRGSLDIAARYQNGQVLQELVIKREDARVIAENAQTQRLEMAGEGSASHSKVLMYLHQTSVDSMKVGKKSAEKGIVEAIDLMPRPLIYASDLAGQRIKDAIKEPGGNPYEKGFVVDLDVMTMAGRPKAYRIIEVHDVIDLGE